MTKVETAHIINAALCSAQARRMIGKEPTWGLRVLETLLPLGSGAISAVGSHCEGQITAPRISTLLLRNLNHCMTTMEQVSSILFIPMNQSLKVHLHPHFDFTPR